MREKIVEFLELTDVNKRIETMIASEVDKFREVARGELADGAKPVPEADRAADLVDKTFRERMPLLVDSLVDVYTRHFTEDELDALLVFYKSEPGRKLNDVGVAVMNDINTASVLWGSASMRTIEDQLATILA